MRQKEKEVGRKDKGKNKLKRGQDLNYMTVPSIRVFLLGHRAKQGLDNAGRMRVIQIL